ncbi:MAG: 1-acyl-sn-glycerol-3-phosphate acyltransferase [Desulforegulaceae bacterium]|nr:1-acyl-sn-glycerol-3-phosphate acyltransferase [Desulforegulaceae bacterium]
MKTKIKNKKTYFFSYLPAKKSLLGKLTLKFLFRGIKTDTKELEYINTQKDPILIFTSQKKNTFAFLYSQVNYKKLGINPPEIFFDNSFILSQSISKFFKIIYTNIRYVFTKFKIPSPYKNNIYENLLIKNNNSGFLALSETQGIYKYFVKKNHDPLVFLLDIQTKTDRPILLIPHFLFFSQRPPKTNPSIIDMIFGTEAEPGITRKIYQLIKGNKKTFISYSKPLNLKEFQAKNGLISKSLPDQAVVLRREIQSVLSKHKQSILGPTLKNREELIDNILTNPKVQKIIHEYSTETETKLIKVQKKAEAYLYEIAANYSMNWIKAYDVVLTWMLKNIFEGMNVDTKGLERVKEMAKKGPLILIPCHKSHLDYLILSYLFHHNQMPCPHIAAGKNLSFWPLGTIFRGGGAFFIRRTFKGAELYSKIFSAYIEKIINEGFNIEFFIEGGRSRTGKLLRPKYGILTQIINAFIQSEQEDLILVPIYIGYDRVLEEKSYLKELSGGEKTPENVSGLFKARKFLNKKYGKVYVNFNEPLSLRELLESSGYTKDPESKKELVQSIGLDIIDRIGKVSVATPYSVVAAAFLNNRQHTITGDKIKEIVKTFLTYLTNSKAVLSDTLLVNPEISVNIVIEAFKSRGFIESSEKEELNEFILPESKRSLLDYYKNNSIIFFIPAAYTALSIMELEAFQFSTSSLHMGYAKFQNLLEKEFTPDQANSPDFIVRKTIKSFIDDAIIVPHQSLPDTYNITALGYKKLKSFSAFLSPYLEAIRVVLNFFLRYPSEDIEYKEALKKIQSMASRLHKRGEIILPESMSKINLKNALDKVRCEGIKGSEQKEKIKEMIKEIQTYINIING